VRIIGAATGIDTNGPAGVTMPTPVASAIRASPSSAPSCSRTQLCGISDVGEARGQERDHDHRAEAHELIPALAKPSDTISLPPRQCASAATPEQHEQQEDQGPVEHAPFFSGIARSSIIRDSACGAGDAP
jgi:hypothetical protein